MCRRNPRPKRLLAGAAFAFALSLFPAGADTSSSPIAPWEEGYAYDEFVLRRLSYVLETIRRTAGSDPELKDVLERLRLRAPLDSLVESAPASWIVPGGGVSRFVIIESRFANQIAALAPAGAYLAIRELEPGAEEICRQLRRIDAEAKRTGRMPVFSIDLAAFPEAKSQPSRRALDALAGTIADEAMVWFLMHEIGHHVLKHTPNDAEPKADSRLRESAADRWASQAMERLGFGLFGAEHYLVGRGAVEICLEELGYVLQESESTHPNWQNRAIAMRQGFDGRRTGQGYPRIIFLPASGLWMIVSAPGDDASGLVGNLSQSQRAASEWRGQSLTIYTADASGSRFETSIADAGLAVSNVVISEFDEANRRVSTSKPIFSIQFNPLFTSWLEIVPGVRLGDLTGTARENSFRGSLLAVGASAPAAEQLVAALRKYQEGEAAIVVSAMKGQIRPDEAASRFQAVRAEYDGRLTLLLGADRYDRLRRLLASDPIAQWAPGQNPSHYRKLEEELLNRNFERRR